MPLLLTLDFAVGRLDEVVVVVGMFEGNRVHCSISSVVKTEVLAYSSIWDAFLRATCIKFWLSRNEGRE